MDPGCGATTDDRHCWMHNGGSARGENHFHQLQWWEPKRNRDAMGPEYGPGGGLSQIREMRAVELSLAERSFEPILGLDKGGGGRTPLRIQCAERATRLPQWKPKQVLLSQEGRDR